MLHPSLIDYLVTSIFNKWSCFEFYIQPPKVCLSFSKWWTILCKTSSVTKRPERFSLMTILHIYQFIKWSLWKFKIYFNFLQNPVDWKSWGKAIYCVFIGFYFGPLDVVLDQSIHFHDDIWIVTCRQLEHPYCPSPLYTLVVDRRTHCPEKN